MSQVCTWKGDGGTDTNFATANNWHGSVADHTAPVAGDDVVMANAVNCAIAANTVALKSLDMTGYTGTLSGASSITVRGLASTTDVVKIAGTISWTGTLNLNPVAADTDIQLTANAKSLTAITINGNTAGDVMFMDAVTLTGACTLTNGHLHADGDSDDHANAHSWVNFTTATGTKTFIGGNCTITLTKASGTAWSWSTTNATLTEGTCTIVCNGATPTFAGGGETYATVTFNTGAGVHTITGANTFGTLNFAGSAVKTDSLITPTGTIVTGTLNLDGNSSINRIFVQSETLGTVSTLTLTGATISGCSNVDFRDITFVKNGAISAAASNGGDGDVRFTTSAVHGLTVGEKVTIAGMGEATYNGLKTVSAVSDTTHFEIDVAYSANGDEVGTYGGVDLSGISGLSGDCGGNTITGGGTLIFTTADDWYFYQTTNSGTHNFSDYTQWYQISGGTTQMASTRCVLPQDNAYFDASSINGTGTVTVDQDMPRVCKTLDFTGVDAMAFHMNNIAQTLYGGLTFVSNVTLTQSKNIYFEGRNSFVLTTNNVKMGASGYSGHLYIQMIGGTLTLGSNFVYDTNTNIFYINNGTFDADIYNVTAFVNSSNSNTRTILMGSGIWTVRSDSTVSGWNLETITNLTNPTTMGETSTINFGLTSGSTAQKFAGGGCVYNNITMVTGNTGIVTLTGSNTFATFTINAPKTVKFTDGTDQTVTSFVATGTAVNGITLNGTSTAGWKISDTTGTNTVSYCDISYSTAEGGATWDASDGTNANTIGNSGWTWPAGGATGFMTTSKFWGA